MIENLVLLLVGIHFGIFVLNFYREDSLLGVYGTIMWFVLAILSMQIQIPYSLICEQCTVVEGYFTHSDYGAAALFALLGIINAFLVLVYRNKEIDKELKERKNE